MSQRGCGLAEDMTQLTCWISCIARRMEERRRGKARWLPSPEAGFVLLLSRVSWFWEFLVLLNHCRAGLLLEGGEGQDCFSEGVSPFSVGELSVRPSRFSQHKLSLLFWRKKEWIQQWFSDPSHTKQHNEAKYPAVSTADI